jgi:hypothetical protein
MSKHSIVACAAVIVACAACGRTTPTSPSPSGSSGGKTVTLQGTVVTDQTGAPLGGATVAVVNGASAGRQVVSDGQGHYTLTGLEAGDVTIAVSAPGYLKLTKPLSLSTSSIANFPLSYLPAEFTTTVEILTTVSNPDGTSSAFGEVKNIGEGCASNLSATGDILDDKGQSLQSVSWSMVTNQVLKPGDVYRYELRGLTSAQAAAVRTYKAVMKWTTVLCS